LGTALSLWIPKEQSYRDCWEPDLSTCMCWRYPPEIMCESKGVTEKSKIIFTVYVMALCYTYKVYCWRVHGLVSPWWLVW
jgi:hypothetical protein